MKKNIFNTIIILITLIFTFSGTALAEYQEIEVFEEDIIEDQPSSTDLEPDVIYDIEQVGMPEIPVEQLIFMQWEKEGYPDDIGGFFYDSENDTFGVLVVNPSRQRTDELHEMFEGRVILVPCSFSYNELMRVQNEITEMMISNPESGIYGNGIGWTSRDRNVYGFGESGKEFRVTVTVDESVFDHYYTGLTGRYGDRVFVEAGGMPVYAEDMDGGMMPGSGSLDGGAGIIPIEISGTFIGNVGNVSTGGSNNMYLWIITGIALLCVLLLLVRFRLQPAPAKQTVNGNIIAAGTTLTHKQIIAAIKSSGIEPGKNLFPSILKKIDSM